MKMKKIFSPTTTKLFIMIISQILLKTATVSSILTYTRRGLIFYFISSMFAVLSILLVYYQAYKLLIENGFLELDAFFIMLAVTVLSSIVFHLLAKFCSKKIKGASHNHSSHKKEKSESVDENIDAIVKSFLEGVFDEKK